MLYKFAQSDYFLVDVIFLWDYSLMVVIFLRFQDFYVTLLYYWLYFISLLIGWLLEVKTLMFLSKDAFFPTHCW